jgi:hypothetical protein
MTIAVIATCYADFKEFIRRTGAAPVLTPFHFHCVLKESDIPGMEFCFVLHTPSAESFLANFWNLHDMCVNRVIS